MQPLPYVAKPWILLRSLLLVLLWIQASVLSAGNEQQASTVVAGAVAHLPAAVRNSSGRSHTVSVESPADVSRLLSTCEACLYLREEGVVQVFETTPEAVGPQTLEDFVSMCVPVLDRALADGKEAVLAAPFEYRLPKRSARLFESTLTREPEPRMQVPAPTSVVLTDTFEGGILSTDNWVVDGHLGTRPDVTRCSAYDGSQSLDMVRGGDGAYLGCSNTVGPGLFNAAAVRNAQLVRGASSGTVAAFMSLDLPSQLDAAGLGATTDGINWVGTFYYGRGGWTAVQKDVKAWASLGDLSSYSAVLVGMLLVTESGTGWGVRFDNFTIDLEIPATYPLTVTKTGTGSGTVTSSPSGINCGSTCSGSFVTNQNVTLTAATAQGSKFEGWSGSCSGTSTTCIVTMSAAKSVTAQFNIAPSEYKLTVTKSGTGSGNVISSPAGIDCGSTCSASFASGQSVTLTAAASLPATFVGWSGACTGTGTCVVTMSQARSVMATFNALPPGQEMALSQRRVSVRVWYRNQYSGAAGSANPLPQDDAFGFFHFGDPNNPEVFVKVLDFGADSPYLLFYAGLTDFEYDVEFKNVATGKTVSLTKPAGSFDGGANNTALPHRIARAVLWSRDGSNWGAVPQSGLLEETVRRAPLLPTSHELPAEETGAAGFRRVETVPSPNAKEIVLSKGKVAVSVTWKSQYSGETGEGTPIPQKDEFAFFYFSNPGNPEVFVKVLDFGETSPYLLFYAGLTDFEYTVTFRNVETQQSVSFKKEAGTFNGGADNKTFLHAPSSLTFTTLAGSTGGAGWFDGAGTHARFNSPYGLAADAAGNVYVADGENHTIRKVSPAGVVTTLAGKAGASGSADGTGSEARFNSPTGITTDSTGNVYVADRNNHTVRKISPAGVVTTLAGKAGTSGITDGTGSAGRFNNPTGVATDSTGIVYVADGLNHTVRKISPAGSVTTLAGAAGTSGSADGTGSAARFYIPYGVATDSSGNVYIADLINHTIRKISPAGVVMTLAGNPGTSGSADGAGSDARFNYPRGVATDSGGNVYVADTDNQTIRKISPAGVVTTLAGKKGPIGSTDGAGSEARFAWPSGVATDSAGNVLVADTSNNTLRGITPAGVVTTLAGAAAQSGSSDGAGSEVRFNGPTGLATDSGGNVYVADAYNHTIRRINTDGAVTTFAGKAGESGSVDGTGSEARFYYPGGLAADSGGNVFVADGNNTIRQISPVGIVTTLAGKAGTSGSADGTGSEARFNVPVGLATDSGGNVYVADTNNHVIRQISPAGVVTTLAGKAGASGSSDGTGSGARFFGPYAVATDSAGNVYVSDRSNHTIRKISPTGVVTTLAGKAGTPGSADGTGGGARFYYPTGVATDSAGNIYVADPGSITSGADANNLIRKVTPSAVVTTLAGKAGSTGSADGTGSEARFNWPSGVALDSAGNMYVADTQNNSIRRGFLALADNATIDKPTGPAGQQRHLGTSPQTATSWNWDVVRREAGSVARLSSPSISNPTFTPDVPGLFIFRLTASDGKKTSITLVELSVTR